MHCDLKPDNILVSRDGAYKIGDLGQSTTLKAWDEQEGDACYLSRDLLESNPSTAADLFSFGIMLFEIKSGEPLPGSPYSCMVAAPLPHASKCFVRGDALTTTLGYVQRRAALRDITATTSDRPPSCGWDHGRA